MWPMQSEGVVDVGIVSDVAITWLMPETLHTAHIWISMPHIDASNILHILHYLQFGSHIFFWNISTNIM